MKGGIKEALSLESTEQVRAISRFLCTTDLNSITFVGAGPDFTFFKKEKYKEHFPQWA